MLGAKAIARAKINLYLEVGAKRPDGFHDITSVMQAIDVSDELYFRQTDGSAGLISVRCSDRRVPVGEDNIVWKAIEVFLDKTCVVLEGGVEVIINKRIPVGAGLAGGSADAAAALLAMDRMLELELLETELMEMASMVGSDVPFCMVGGTSLAKGRGEILEKLPDMPSFKVVLAGSDAEASTAEVYRRFDEMNEPGSSDGMLDRMLEAVRARDLDAVCGALYNDLEAVTTEAEQVEEYKKTALDAGAPGAMMTGSGPTVFALVQGLEEAAEVALELGQVAPVTIITSFAGRGAELG